MDACAGQILATELTHNDADDGLQVDLLLNQVTGPLASFTGDGAVRRIRKALRPRRRAPSRGGRYRAAALERSVERNRRDSTHTARQAHAVHHRARGMAWQKASGYNERARAKTAMSRFKRVIGCGLWAVVNAGALLIHATPPPRGIAIITTLCSSLLVRVALRSYWSLLNGTSFA